VAQDLLTFLIEPPQIERPINRIEGFLMSTIAMSLPTTPICSLTAANGGSTADEVVEINLLLPAQWARDLMQLSQERGQSVGQILRSMIGHALHDGSPSS
jgi:hypothetical protein